MVVLPPGVVALDALVIVVAGAVVEVGVGPPLDKVSVNERLLINGSINWLGDISVGVVVENGSFNEICGTIDCWLVDGCCCCWDGPCNEGGGGVEEKPGISDDLLWTIDEVLI